MSDLPTGPAIAAVLYRPTPAHLDTLAGLAARAPAAYLYDNGGLDAAGRARLAAIPGLRLLGDGRNAGIARGLNAAAEAALADGRRHLLLLDQDATPGPDLPARLLAALERLTATGAQVAVVGPQPRAGEGAHKAPRYPARPGVVPVGSLEPVDFLATTGSLIALDAYRAVGPFRDDFFIDGVDLEWCFRAWARGWSCWADRDTGIVHHVGGGVIRARFLPVAMPRQSVPRMATYLRNSVYAWRLAHVPWRWRLRQAAYLPLQAGLYWADAGYRPAVLAGLGRGVLDGLRGQLGPPVGPG
ncbi:glycosyltransferase family 2 protein [uncultured Methylobacterium sp.]|jgi:rhamnosyltransferase|uniref:glycosyltransferase family 2 protein n=1 Tax=uncultured Methylobacterium sp. TaxID=157278 RepID=UPI00262685C2|nr:glycosyltransferase family 2 protein [uncultured Methylobacterium sp.]